MGDARRRVVSSPNTCTSFREWKNVITSSVAFFVAFLSDIIYYSVLFMNPFIMKLCFLGVGKPTRLELPLHILTQDLSFSVILSFMFYSFFFFLCHSIEKSACCDPLRFVSHYMRPMNPFNRITAWCAAHIRVHINLNDHVFSGFLLFFFPKPLTLPYHL